MSSVTDPIILPKDVLLVPVDELPEETRRQFAYENGDFAITRLRSRTPSKIIDAQAAALISEFRQAKTLAQAIRDFSQANQRDPNEVLESAFPLIQQLVNIRCSCRLIRPKPGGLRPAWKITPAWASCASCSAYRSCRILKSTRRWTRKGRWWQSSWPGRRPAR